MSLFQVARRIALTWGDLLGRAQVERFAIGQSGGGEGCFGRFVQNVRLAQALGRGLLQLSGFVLCI